MTPQQKKLLRSQAHSLKPVVTIGQAGLTDAVFNEIDVALDHHELIKIRVRSNDRLARKTAAEQICAAKDAELIQSIGQIAVLYRKGKENKKSGH